MSSDNSRPPVSPRTIPWPWRLLTALLLALAVALVLQVVPVPTMWRVVLVIVLAMGAIAVDVVARARYTGGGPQRGFIQIVLPLLALLVFGTLLTIAAPLPLVLGVAISVLVGVIAFVVLHWGQRNQVRHAKRMAEPQDAANWTQTEIAERGGAHHPGRDDLPGSSQERRRT